MLLNQRSRERAQENEMSPPRGVVVQEAACPLEGWDGPKPERHHDYIAPSDFPSEWLGWPLTVEVEAKAKEMAIQQLQHDLNRSGSTKACVRGIKKGKNAPA